MPDSVHQHSIKRLITPSTAKAAYSINATGRSKTMMKKVMQAKAQSMRGVDYAIGQNSNHILGR